MKKIFQYIMLAVVTIVMASCTSDIEETTAATGKNNIQLVVGEFPAFGDSQTRTIGTLDEGKTSWAEGDELLLEMTSKTLGTKYAAFTYNGSSWELTSGELSYKEDEVPTFPHVYYAPNYKWEAGKLVLKEGKVAGTDEYIEGKANITPNGEGINVSFAEATRNYSRLRIATMPNMPITVDIDIYTPAGSSDMKWDQNYALTSDEKGNAYLYGTFVPYFDPFAHEVLPGSGVPIARVCESPNAGNSPTTNCTLFLAVVAVVSSISLVHEAITIVTTASMMY